MADSPSEALVDYLIGSEVGKQVDIIVGIPSYNEESQIAFVAEQAAKGLAQHFPDQRSLVVCLDGGSADATVERFQAADTGPVPKEVYISMDRTGKGAVLKHLFEEIVERQAKVGICVDSDLKSISPDWIRWMVEPALAGKMDLGTPRYSRHPYDGTITNNICYPFVRGLLGYNVRQPIGGDFVFSDRAAALWLSREWVKTTYEFGIDIFMTSNVILGGLQIAEIGLGAKIHKPSAPNLGPMFVQVISTLFAATPPERVAEVLGREVVQPPQFGKAELDTPQDLQVDVEALAKKAQEDFEAHQMQVPHFLDDATFASLQEGFAQRVPRMLAEHWVEILHAAWQAFHRTKDEAVRESIVLGLRPLYFARVVNFIDETQGMDYAAAEAEIVRQAELLGACFLGKE